MTKQGNGRRHNGRKSGKHGKSKSKKCVKIIKRIKENNFPNFGDFSLKARDDASSAGFKKLNDICNGVVIMPFGHRYKKPYKSV
jgi:hypothetical protein